MEQADCRGVPTHILPRLLKFSVFYIDIQYECDNAFPNLKCVPEPFFLEKSTGESIRQERDLCMQ